MISSTLFCGAAKQRDDKGNLIDLRVVFGDEDDVLDLLAQSTAYVERTHLTMRHFNSRLVRQSLAFSKEFDLHCTAAAWEDLPYLLPPIAVSRQPNQLQ